VKVYVATDLEGATGVTGGWSEISPGCREHEFAKRMLTADINACAEGAFDGGADEVVVWDGHGASLSVNVLDIDPRVRLIKGRAPTHLPLLDSSFDAMILLGLHAMDGAADGLMNGTWAGQRVWLNGTKIGEIGLWMAMAAQLGVPTVMCMGDEAAAKEAAALVPEVEQVASKKGISRFCCEVYPPSRVWPAIREATARSLGRVKGMPVYLPSLPVEMRVEYGNTQLVDWVGNRPGVERVDGYTLSYTSDSLLDAVGALFYIAWWNLGDKPAL